MHLLVNIEPVRAEAVTFLSKAIEEKRALPSWRQHVLDLIEHKMFDRTVLVLIFLNCVFLAIVDPTDRSNTTIRNKVVNIADYIFTAIFTLEVVIRIAGRGFYRSTFSYMRDPWNRLDFVIVASGIAIIIADLSGASGGAVAISGLRAFRLLRPLRAVSKVKEVQVIVNSVLHSLPQLADVLLLYFFFLLMMGIVALQLWKGLLAFRCRSCDRVESSCELWQWNGGPINRPEQASRVCNPSYSSWGYRCPWGYTCVEVGDPNHGKTSFNNIWITLLTLFTVVTMEGWSDVMYNVMDAMSPLTCLYFLFIILFGSFFIVNLTLVIINTAFEENVSAQNDAAERDEDGDSAVAPLQGEEKEGDAAAEISKAPRTLRQRIQCVIWSKWFVYFIMLAIFCNTLILALQHHKQPDELTQLQHVTDILFTSIFGLELILRITALEWADFVADRFNLFDLVIVIASLVDIIFLRDQTTGVSVLRAFRLMRIFKLAKQFPELWLFLQAIAKSIRGVAVLTVLLGLVMFIYALLGMQLFGGNHCRLEPPLPLEEGSSCPGKPRMNFDHLGWALLAVFQVITGEDWQVLMYQGMRSLHDISCFFFLTLYVIGNYVVLNLFIAVLLGRLDSKDFDSSFSGEDDKSIVSPFTPFSTNQVDDVLSLTESVVLPPHDPPPPPPHVCSPEESCASLLRSANSIVLDNGNFASAFSPIDPNLIPNGSMNGSDDHCFVDGGPNEPEVRRSSGASARSHLSNLDAVSNSDDASSNHSSMDGDARSRPGSPTSDSPSRRLSLLSTSSWRRKDLRPPGTPKKKLRKKKSATGIMAAAVKLRRKKSKRPERLPTAELSPTQEGGSEESGSSDESVYTRNNDDVWSDHSVNSAISPPLDEENTVEVVVDNTAGSPRLSITMLYPAPRVATFVKAGSGHECVAAALTIVTLCSACEEESVKLFVKMSLGTVANRTTPQEDKLALVSVTTTANGRPSIEGTEGVEGTVKVTSVLTSVSKSAVAIPTTPGRSREHR
eukprot:Sspe_Gene.61433::Locus_34101_Transcript_1_1_Confidence_1.000_Length_3331::g.61433::m.61433/K04851/CACNA1D; voltage-dependent calcium channel L type alpha-1D